MLLTFGLSSVGTDIQLAFAADELLPQSVSGIIPTSQSVEQAQYKAYDQTDKVNQMNFIHEFETIEIIQPAVQPIAPDTIPASNREITNALIANGEFTREEFDRFIASVDFAEAIQLMDSDAMADYLIAKGWTHPQITDRDMIYAKLLEKGIDAKAMKLTGIGLLTAMNDSRGESLLDIKVADGTSFQNLDAFTKSLMLSPAVIERMARDFDSNRESFLDALSAESFVRLLGATPAEASTAHGPIALYSFASFYRVKDSLGQDILNGGNPVNRDFNGWEGRSYEDIEGMVVPVMLRCDNDRCSDTAYLQKIVNELNARPEGERFINYQGYSYYPNGHDWSIPATDPLKDDQGRIIYKALRLRPDGSIDWRVDPINAAANNREIEFHVTAYDIPDGGSEMPPAEYVVPMLDEGGNVVWDIAPGTNSDYPQGLAKYVIYRPAIGQPAVPPAHIKGLPTFKFESTAFQSPFIDAWTDLMKSRVEAAVNYIKAHVNGVVDYFMVDYETHPNGFIAMAIQTEYMEYVPGARNPEKRYDFSILMKDPRVRELVAQLGIEDDLSDPNDRVGSRPYNLSYAQVYAGANQKEAQFKWHTYFSQMRADALEESMFNPWAEAFPGIKMTNWLSNIHSGDIVAARNFYHPSSIWGLGSWIEGTLPNEVLYGGTPNNYKLITPDGTTVSADQPQIVYDPVHKDYYPQINSQRYYNMFDVMVASLASVTGVAAATELESLHWVTQPDYSGSSAGFGPNAYWDWESMSLQGGEAFGSRVFEIWAMAAAMGSLNVYAGATTTGIMGYEFMDSAAQELNQMLGMDRRFLTEGWVFVDGQRVSVGPQSMDFEKNYLIWGVQTSQNDATRNLYRVMLNLDEMTSGQSRADLILDDGSVSGRVKFRINGQDIEIPNARIVTAEGSRRAYDVHRLISDGSNDGIVRMDIKESLALYSAEIVGGGDVPGGPVQVRVRYNSSTIKTYTFDRAIVVTNEAGKVVLETLRTVEFDRSEVENLSALKQGAAQAQIHITDTAKYGFWVEQDPSRIGLVGGNVAQVLTFSAPSPTDNIPAQRARQLGTDIQAGRTDINHDGRTDETDINAAAAIFTQLIMADLSQLTAAERKELLSVFDFDRTGAINTADIGGFNHQFISKIQNTIDALAYADQVISNNPDINGDGRVTKEDQTAAADGFVKAFMISIQGLSGSERSRMITAFDRNRDGAIDGADIADFKAIPLYFVERMMLVQMLSDAVRDGVRDLDGNGVTDARDTAIGNEWMTLAIANQTVLGAHVPQMIRTLDLNQDNILTQADRELLFAVPKAPEAIIIKVPAPPAAAAPSPVVTRVFKRPVPVLPGGKLNQKSADKDEFFATYAQRIAKRK